MRVYIPATITTLRQLVDVGGLAAPSGIAFALTPRFRESYASGDTDELEYAAMLEAARASLRLLGPDVDTNAELPARRAVIAADVDDVTLRPDLDDAVVNLGGPVPLRMVAAVHVDAPEAEHAVRAAAKIIDEADLGDPDAEFTLGDAEDHEMAWYSPTELPFFLELL